MLNWTHLGGALIIAPPRVFQPFYMEQIWFLRVLVFCSLVSPLVYRLAEHKRGFLLVPVGVAFLLAIWQTFNPIHHAFDHFGYNFYQCLVYGAYFFAGSFLYCTNWRSSRKSLLFLILMAMVLAVVFFPHSNGGLILGEHAYAPDMYYLPLGFLGCLLVFYWAPAIELFFEKVPLVTNWFEYTGKHSYGIYIGHSFFIQFTENVWGWKDVFDKPVLALAKVVFVVGISMLAAYPVTWVTGIVRQKIKSWT